MNCTTDAWKCHVIVRHFRIVQYQETLMEWKFPPNILVGCACLLHQNDTLYTLDTFHYHGLTLVSKWMSNHMSYIMRDEITYPFRKFTGCTVEVWKWMINFITHFINHVITYTCWDWCQTKWVKGTDTRCIVRPMIYIYPGPNSRKG